nr:hypothetical protein [Pseudenhygromyxa sp. WMMC2535]
MPEGDTLHATALTCARSWQAAASRPSTASSRRPRTGACPGAWSSGSRPAARTC